MDRRPVMSAVLFLLLASPAYGQQMSEEGTVERSLPGATKATAAGATAVMDKVDRKEIGGTVPNVQQGRVDLPPKQELEHRVALYESAVRDAESAHASDTRVARLYVQLGLWYQDLALWNRSEADLERAVTLFRRASESESEPETSGELATAINNLGILHVMMWKLSEAERDEQEALRMREEMKDRLQIARSWSDLAALYLAQHKFAKARDFAKQSLAELVANGHADAFDRIFARYAYSLALCSTKDCPSAIPVLKDAIDEAKATMRSGDFPIGLGEFLLGFAYWRSGEAAAAAQYMGQGTSLMKEQLGWGHPTYLNALEKYARFLRENQRGDEAKIVEREIRQAEAVVDVRSMQTQTSTLSFAGLR